MTNILQTSQQLLLYLDLKCIIMIGQRHVCDQQQNPINHNQSLKSYSAPTIVNESEPLAQIVITSRNGQIGWSYPHDKYDTLAFNECWKADGSRHSLPHTTTEN